MFAVEEEWNDEEEGKALTKAVIGSNKQSDSTNVKFGKRSSLIRTLQALGSVPDWSNDAPQAVGSDSETENVPAVHTKRKKKRSKKRKRGAATGEKAEDTVDDTVELGGEEEQTLTVAKKPKKKPIHLGFTKMKNTQFKKAGGKEDSEAVMEEGKTGVNTVKLNRKQWKNKMKNKRTCKNKFVENGNQKQKVKKADSALQQNPEEVVSDLNSNSPKVVQSQTQTKTNKLQKEDGGKAQKRKKVQEGKESSTSTVDTETVQNKKFTEVQKKTKGGNQVQTGSLKASGKELPKLEVERSQEEMREEKHPEPSKRRKQESQVQGRKMEKLRRMLHGSDKKENPAEQQEEEGTHTKEEVKEVPEDRSAALRSRMEQRLESARFRYINEVLYTTSSGEAKRMFIQDPQAFGIYHRGFTAQVQRWPANPVDAIIAYIQHKPASLVVADFGCGDCKIAQSVKNKVHSFDLAPICKLVTVCDMANVPLGDATVHIAVFCLSLMGTNLGDFLTEANRVLVMGGVLKIAEVASRFENVRSFMSALSGLGFKMVTKDVENSHFYSFEFVKTANAPDHVKAGLELRPCVYKKR